MESTWSTNQRTRAQPTTKIHQQKQQVAVCIEVAVLLLKGSPHPLRRSLTVRDSGHRSALRLRNGGPQKL